MQNFDKILASKLNDYPSPNYNHLWSGIESGLNQKTDIRRGIIFWLSMIMMIVLISLFAKTHFPNATFGIDAQPIKETPSPTAALTENIKSHLQKEKGLKQQLSGIPFRPQRPAIKNPVALIKDSKYNLINNSIKLYSNSLNSNTSTDQIRRNRIPPININSRLTLTIPTGIEQLRITPSHFNSALKGAPTDPGICPNFGGFSPKFSLDVYYNQFIPMQRMEVSSPELTDYLNLRKITESPIYSFGAGLRLNYSFHRNLIVSAGIDFSQLNEKFSYSDPAYEQIRTIIIIDTLITPQGPIITTDTSTVRIEGERQVQSLNTMRRVSFPVTIGFYKSSEKFDFAVNGGILMHLITRTEGKILNSMSIPVNYNHSNPPEMDLYHEDLSFSLMANLNLLWKRNSRTSLFIEPQIRFDLENLSADGYPITQQYIKIGFLTGARFNF